MYISKNFKELYRNGQFTLKNFDLDSLLPKKEVKHSDKYHYLLHRIYVGRSMDKRKDSESWINLSKKHLEDVVNWRRASTIIKFWKDHGVIEVNNHYQKNEKCKGYRFTEAYRQEPMHVTPFKDKRFEQSLDRKKRKQYYKPDLTQLNQSFIHFNLLELRIDIERATDMIENRFKRVRSKFTRKTKYQSSATAIHNKEYYFKRDNKGRRIHNNWVNLPKPVKKFAYLETGEELINIDVVNSQPLMLCVLLKQHNIQDIEQYVSDCENGMLYETLANAANISIADRSKFKRNFFKRVLYGRNQNACNSPEFAIFQKLYPTVAAFVVEAKNHSHSDLAITLQRIESEIILDKVIQGIAMEYHPENYFALTIHDSVTTIRSNEEDMKQRIYTAFAEYGITPKLKTETF